MSPRTLSTPALTLALCAALIGFVPYAQVWAEDDGAPSSGAVAALTEGADGDMLQEIDAQIANARQQITDAAREHEQLTLALDRKTVELSNQQARIKDLSHTLTQTRRELEARFQNSLKDRGVHLDQDLRTYWQQVAALDNERANEAAMLADHQSLSAQLALGKQKADALNTRLDELQIHRKHMQLRAALRTLERQATVEQGATVECAETLTLRRCMQSSADAALAESTEHFRRETLKAVLAELGSNLDPDSLDLDVEVVGQDVIDQHFEGAASHHSRLRLTLRSRPDRALACRLVDVDARGCTAFFAYRERTVLEPDQADAGARWAPLTIRSNVFNDEVLIDGNVYGPTPVTVNLPTGRYQVAVRKGGFQTATSEVALNRGQTVRLELEPEQPAAQ